MLASQKTPPMWRAARFVASAAVAAAGILTGAESARADTYAVLVRQIEGYESVPARMICALNKICRGVISISAPGGHRRVFITGMIDGGNAYFGFYAEGRDLSCSRGQDFVHLALARPPMTAHAFAFACDHPPISRDAPQDPTAESPVPKSITPPLAMLRIDLRSIESSNGR
jgi:hypothetical protein